MMSNRDDVRLDLMLGPGIHMYLYFNPGEDTERLEELVAKAGTSGKRPPSGTQGA